MNELLARLTSWISTSVGIALIFFVGYDLFFLKSPLNKWHLGILVTGIGAIGIKDSHVNPKNWKRK